MDDNCAGRIDEILKKIHEFTRKDDLILDENVVECSHSISEWDETADLMLNQFEDLPAFFERVSEICGRNVLTLDGVCKILQEDSLFFLKKFNEKFNCSVESVEDAVKIVSLKEEENESIKRKNEEMSIENEKLRSELYELKRRLKECDDLSMRFRTVENEKVTLQQLNRKLEQDCTNLKTELQLCRKVSDQNSEALENFKSLLDMQIEETQKLSQQRSELVELVGRQNDLQRLYEAKLKENQQQKPPVREQPKTTAKVVEKIAKPDCIELLASICVALQEKLPEEVANHLLEIRDSQTGVTCDIRIMNIITCMCDWALSLQKKLDDKNIAITELKEGQQVAEERSSRILRAFENELRFLDRLLHSNDLERIVLFRAETDNSLVLDNDCRDSVIRHVVTTKKFIDEHIGTIRVPENMNLPDAIFRLIDSGEFFERVAQLTDLVTHTGNLDSEFTYDLFYAQCLMAEVVRNYAASLASRLSYALHEKQVLENQLSHNQEDQKTIEKLQRTIMKLQRREKRIVREFAKIAQIPGEQEIEQILHSFQCIIEDNNRKEQQLSDVDAELQQLKKEMVSLVMKTAAAEPKVQTPDYKWLKDGLSSRQNMLSRIQESNAVLKLMCEELISIHSSEMSCVTNHIVNCNRRIQELEDFIQTEKQKNQNLEEKYRDVESKNAELIRNTEEIKVLFVGKLKALEVKEKEITDQCQSLQDQNTNLTNEKDSLHSKIRQLKCDLANQLVQLKSWELKMKMETERFEQEKRAMTSRLTAQLTACHNQFQAEIDHLHEKEVQQMNEAVEICGDCIDESLQSSNVLELIRHLHARIEILESERKTYCSVIDDFQASKQALSLTNTNRLSCRIKLLLEELSQVKKLADFKDKKIEQLTKEIDVGKRDHQLLSNDARAASQWDSWARRLCSLFPHSRSPASTTERLRRDVEEIIMSSISNQSMLFKLTLLRTEKRLLCKFNKGLLTVRLHQRGNWHSLIYIIAAIKRMQQLAGCVAFSL